MPTPVEILKMTASLQNDSRQKVYTPAACLPYFNMALRALQEEFELNNIPVTNETSAILNVPQGTDAIAITGTTPGYPADLVEIRQLWESPEGLEQWTPMKRKEFLPHYLEDGVEISQFIIWAWINNEIKLLAANADIDLKLDYTKSIFSTVDDNNIEDELGASFKTIFNYLGFKTAAYCSMFIGENPERAVALNEEANSSLTKALGISIKGSQVMGVRRRPFMQAYKRRGYIA
jgi:hypothetical protein